MPVYTDQTGRSITLEKIPKRIISLVPSQTQLLHDLGLEQEVVGITKFCILPPKWFQNKARIGGTKDINRDIIHQLQPDLIIANKEENVKEQVEELLTHYPTWISDIHTPEEALQMIRQIGLITHKEKEANDIITRITHNFALLKTHLAKSDGNRIKTAYLIWQQPYMTTGGDTFIHSMLEVAGFENIFKNQTRYPETSIEELRAANCELLLLSTEPFPFKQKHIDALQPHLPNTKILLVDGKKFSWYGSHLLQSPEYFIQLQKGAGC